jgi:pilus assembly protein Flp/PilA
LATQLLLAILSCCTHAFPPQALVRNHNPRRKRMKNLILQSLTRLHKDEAGQGLVEYALIIALVAFAAVISMQTLANDINNAFVGIGNILSSYVP